MTDRICVWTIPADSDKPMGLTDVDPRNLDDMKKLVGGGWIEIVKHRTMYDLFHTERGDMLVMVVDEEGMYKTLEQNVRASIFYPHGMGIIGDAFLTIYNPHEPLFKTLPPEFDDWEGPGHPLPSALDTPSPE